MANLIDSLSMIIALIGGLVGIIGGGIGIYIAVSMHRKEDKMWQVYFSLLPELREGKTWDPENPKEIKIAEQMVEKGILKRSPLRGFKTPESTVET